MNLLSETKKVLADNGKLPRDVRWVGTKLVATTWGNFAKVADVEYNAGFGAPQVAKDLIVSGDGWWMERHEYDGSEWWEFKKIPDTPLTEVVIKSVVATEEEVGWVKLMDIKLNKP